MTVHKRIWPETGRPPAYILSVATFRAIFTSGSPKHGVREAIGRCGAAGTKVIIVTGDHPLTAEAIGRKINLMLSETKPMMAKRKTKPIDEIDDDEVNAIVVHDEQIDSLTDAGWDNPPQFRSSALCLEPHLASP